MKYKKHFVSMLSIILAFLILMAALTIVLDPCFHYHKPLEGIAYTLLDSMERYTNDGIMRNFDYDAIITGTSMTANFKKTEMDALFGTNAIKVPYSGGSFHEIDDAINVALKNNANIKYVVRCLDYGRILEKSYINSYDNYPEYLYDNDLLNDCKYWFDKEVFVKGTMAAVLNSVKGMKMTTFDEYANWTELNEFGAKSVLSKYERSDEVSAMNPFSSDDCQMVHDNIELNVIETAKNYPDVEFYYFLSPYSILYYDMLYRTGDLEKTLSAEKYAIEMILQCPNIKLFSYNDMFDMITDLDNYMDNAHYREEINSMILESMKDGTHLLTESNYLQYWETCNDFYMNFDYDAYYESVAE